MSRERLAIPLSTNPTRQKFWRVVGLLILATVCLTLGLLIDRMWHYRSTAAQWPANATAELRIIKTPRTSTLVENQFGNATQVLPGSPWTITEAMAWSAREFNLYVNTNEIVGVRVDGDIPSDVQSALKNWGWKTLVYRQQTLIYRDDAADPLPAARHVNPWLTIPYFNGTYTTISAGGKATSLPIHISPTGVTLPVNMERFIPTATLTLPEDTEIVGSFSIPKEESRAFFPQNISAAFPGLQLLNETSLQSGFDLLLGIDNAGLAFLAAGKATNFNLEQLGAIATEGVALQNLSTTALTSDDFTNVTEIRSTGDASVDVNADNSLSSAVAKNSSGDVFRLTQSPTGLIISNRPTNIGKKQMGYNSTCLKHASGFIKPLNLLTQIPTLEGTLGNSPSAKIMHANEIAFRKHWLKICW
ncbi:MAG TPA: hypothetical protein PLK06_00225 [bacterium]|nr:hypothetical protein [bacterium]